MGKFPTSRPSSTPVDTPRQRRDWGNSPISRAGSGNADANRQTADQYGARPQAPSRHAALVDRRYLKATHGMGNPRDARLAFVLEDRSKVATKPVACGPSDYDGARRGQIADMRRHRDSRCRRVLAVDGPFSQIDPIRTATLSFAETFVLYSTMRR